MTTIVYQVPSVNKRIRLGQMPDNVANPTGEQYGFTNFNSGRLLSDHIHYGEPWQIGLKHFLSVLEDNDLHISIQPLRKGTIHAFVNQAYVERFEGIEIAKIHELRSVPVYQAAIIACE